MPRHWFALGALLVGTAGTPALHAADEPEAGVVCHVKVVSDKVEDVSSLEAWKQSFIRDGMTDQQKALAIWRSVVQFRHQEPPPQEWFSTGCVHDPIKTFNVYGYGMCCCASCNVEALARYLGFRARGWGINGHSVPEVSWDGTNWHMLDASLMCYFPQADGRLAGVEEMVRGVQGWFAKNPGLRKDNDKLYKFGVKNGWKNGPEVLTRCPFYDPNGWLPAATHGWYSTMQEYDCKPFIYEYGYSQGYQLNIQLRKGERLTRNWSNRGLHINSDGSGPMPGCLRDHVGRDDMRYAPQFGDRTPGRIGNGTHVYDVPLADGNFRRGALAFDNLAGKPRDQGSPLLRVQDAEKPGMIVLRMPSSYVYLGGEAICEAVVGTGGGVEVSISDNHGLDWKAITRIAATGKKRIDLKPFVYRRYDYRLKLVLRGAGTGLNSLRLVHDIQHSQRALPALAEGKNTISFVAGPAEGTITIEGSTHPKAPGKQLRLNDFHPQIENVAGTPPTLQAGKGHITFPVATPGDLVRLRFGCHFRARDPRDAWDLQVSLDDGKTWKTVDRAAGPTPGSCQYVTFAAIPAGIRQAWVRYAGVQRNTTCLFDYRIDADYREPHGGFRPIRVTYEWEENSKPKQDVHVARHSHENYVITCVGKPTMKSIRLEWAD